jgi:hypothetical protein
MSRAFKRLYTATILAIFLMPAGSPLLSKAGRDFTGNYEVSDVNDLGLDVAFTLSVRIFNLSESDVNGATITLEDSVLVGNTYTTFPTTAIPSGASAKLNAAVTLPHSEYDLWQAGGTPHIEIEFRNARGETVHRLIEMSPKPVGEE